MAKSDSENDRDDSEDEDELDEDVGDDEEEEDSDDEDDSEDEDDSDDEGDSDDEEDSDEDEESEEDSDDEDSEEGSDDEEDSDEGEESEEDSDEEPAVAKKGREKRAKPTKPAREKKAKEKFDPETYVPKKFRKTGRRRGKKHRQGESGSSDEKQISAGARLAAARAAKAARKAALRKVELSDEEKAVEAIQDSELAKRAQAAGDWAKNNQALVIGAVAAVVIAVAAFFGWGYYSQSTAAGGAAALREAVEISQATIRPANGGDPDEEPPPPANEDERSYPTIEARSRAALEAYRVVLSQHGSSDAAIWARLGEARSLFELGEYADARRAYETAMTDGGNDPAIALRALEGIGMSYEAEENFDQATETYRRITRLRGNTYTPIANYHLARMQIATGNEDEAKTTLRELVDSLRSAEESEEQLDYPYLLAQAELRLRELDPEAAASRMPSMPGAGGGLGGGLGDLLGGGGGGGGLEGLSPEQRQRLMELLSKQRPSGGPPGGGDEGGE